MSVKYNTIFIVWLGILCVITIFLWWTLLHASSQRGLTVAFLDIGQGDSIFIESPTGTKVLIDGGRDGRVLRQLSKIMPFFDRKIEMVIATHPDSDHIGGLLSVLQRYDVGLILRSGVMSDTPATESLLKTVAGKHTREVLARRGQVYDLGGGAVLQILFPDREVDTFETNQASIVARLVYGEHSFLFTGDSPKSIEKYLVSLSGKKLKTTVLKLGHHGSHTSTSDIFLGFVAPELAIVSAGKGNSYGHPHKSVIEKLKQFEIPVLSTIDCGTIVFKSDGDILRHSCEQK